MSSSAVEDCRRRDFATAELVRLRRSLAGLAVVAAGRMCSAIPGFARAAEFVGAMTPTAIAAAAVDLSCDDFQMFRSDCIAD